MPVTSNFFVTHQWLRELKRRGFRTAVGVYFRVGDGERVWVGRYNGPKRSVTAAHAHRLLRESNELGFQAILTTSIPAGAIKSARIREREADLRRAR